MRKILKPRSVSAQIMIMIGSVLIITSAALIFFAAKTQHQEMAHAIEAENVQVLHMATLVLETQFPDLAVDHQGGDLSGDTTMVWPSMPDAFDPDILDRVSEATGTVATLFRLDATTGAFERVATTVFNGDGSRALGSVLSEAQITTSLVSGVPIHSTARVDDATFASYFLPIFDDRGRTIGAFGLGQDTTSISASLQQALRLEIAGSAAISLILMILCTLLARRTMKPLSIAEGAITKLAAGSVDTTFAYLDRKDEFGDIFRGLDVLQRSIKEAQERKDIEAQNAADMTLQKRNQDAVVDALSQGLERLGTLDLTTHIESRPDAPFPADYEALRTSFNLLVDNLAESVAAIQDVANEVNSDAREMASSSQDLSGRTESQAATLEQSAAALEELSASVQSTAANAAEAEADTNENRAVAKRTGDIVETAISAMAAIEDSSQKITQIISVIDDIAFQTNLLALNAGVEAARAGDAGRGFAVVASEVRALAQHSSASAQEIKALIASSRSHVENGSKLVRNAGLSIEDIIARVDRVAGLVSDIAVSAKEQSIGVSEINTGVRELDSATQRNAAMAEEASAASDNLTSAADRLADHLGRFRVSAAPQKSNWAAEAVRATVASAQDIAVEAQAFAAAPRTTAPAPAPALAPAPRAQAPEAPQARQADFSSQADVFKDF